MTITSGSLGSGKGQPLDGRQLRVLRALGAKAEHPCCDLVGLGIGDEPKANEGDFRKESRPRHRSGASDENRTRDLFFTKEVLCR